MTWQVTSNCFFPKLVNENRKLVKSQFLGEHLESNFGNDTTTKPPLDVALTWAANEWPHRSGLGSAELSTHGMQTVLEKSQIEWSHEFPCKPHVSFFFGSPKRGLFF